MLLRVFTMFSCSFVKLRALGIFISYLEGDPGRPSRSTKIPKFHDFEPFFGRWRNSDPSAPIVRKFSVCYPLVFNLHGIVIWSCMYVSVKLQHDSVGISPRDMHLKLPSRVQN